MEYSNLERTLKSMPQYFSSNEFSRKAQKYGVPMWQIKNGIIAKFLHKYAIQTNSRRTWVKKQEINTEVIENIDFSVEKAIKLLKSKGYKIMKPITEYKEL
tara:strand:- start:308 stop:610 length:303 start_codon:yes stop_codon:yes gene_type:complete